MTEEANRVGEVVEASTTSFFTQCYELYRLPALGSLVKTRDGLNWIYGVVFNAMTSGMEPGRRPIARGKDEADEEAIYRSSPQLLKLLRSEFQALVVGHQQDSRLKQYLPPTPARIHSFVYQCADKEVRQFSQSFDFLNILLQARVEVAVEELVAAALRQMGAVYGVERQRFMVGAGKELAVLLSADYGRLKAILRGLK